MEATGGFEPPNKSFANFRLRPLGYVALYLIYWWCRGGDSNSYSLYGHSALNAACLPIPPPRLITNSFIIASVAANYIFVPTPCLDQ